MKLHLAALSVFVFLLLPMPARAAAPRVPPAGGDAAPSGPPAPVNLSAPSLARTATTAVLLWDRPAGGAEIAAYQILCDGEPAGETTRLSYTARNLTPGRKHRIAVRSRDAKGNVSPASAPVDVDTKPAGPVFNVRTHGARGDGVTKDTAAIQQAIGACTPGGTVLIPAGVYRVDHLELKSDMTLELATGATLQFIGRGEGSYPETTFNLPGPDGDVPTTDFALISARRADRLTITGGGVIHGNGETWWPHRESPRPRVLRFTACSDVFVQGITLDDPPAWNTHVVYVDRAVFSEVKFRKVSTARGTNGDGLNPDSSRDVLIVGCTFANQDDSVAIKAGRVSRAQPRRQRSCERITIRDCIVDGKLTPGAHPLGFGVGSETCGGVRHVLIRDCEFRDAASIANIKSNRERLGAVVEDIRVENCVYRNTVWKDELYNRAPITIDLFYYRDFGAPDSVAPLTPATPVFRDIHFKNIVIENPRGRFAYLCGLVEQPVRGITFENVSGSAKSGLHGQNLDGIELRNVAITAAEGAAFEWIKVENRKTTSGPTAAVALPPKEKFHLFLLIGQSNMAGRGTVAPQDQAPHPRVLTLNKAGEWVPAVDPIHFDKSVAGVGLGRTFGLEIASAKPGVTIGLIPCAVGGTAIDRWQPGALDPVTKSHPWDDAMRRAKLALQAGTLRGILWHQGEGDAKRDLAPAYGAKLADLIGRLRVELGAPSVPFIAGQLGRFAESPWDEFKLQVDQAMRDLPARVPHTAYVSAEGLQHRGDKVHFDADSYREFGRRYAEAFLKLARE